MKLILKKVVTISCLYFLASTIFATSKISTPKTLTLKDAIFLALRYNPTIQNVELNRIVQKFNLLQARNAFELQYALTGNFSDTQIRSNNVASHGINATLVPNIALKTATGTQFQLSMNNPTNNGVWFNPGVNFTIIQPLIQGSDRNVVLAPLRNAYDQELGNKLALKSNIINTIVTVITDFRNVVTAERSLQINQESLKRAVQNYNATLKFLKAGQKAKMDVAQAQFNVTQDKISILVNENAVATSKQTLLLNIGLDPKMPLHIADEIEAADYKPPSQKDSITIALANDPTYQQDLLQISEDERNLLVAKDNQKPELDATAQATWGNGTGGAPFNNFQGITNNFNTSKTIGLQLTVPINNLSLQGNIVQGQVQLRNDQIAADLQRDTVITNVLNGLRTLQVDKLTLEGSIEAAQLQKQNLENTYKQFKAGQIDSLAVSQQQDAYTQSEQQVLAAQITYLNDITSYKQLLQQTLADWKIKLKY